VDDVRAALHWLDGEFHLPLILAGFSFGAVTGLTAACPDPRVKFCIALGLPVVPLDERRYDFGFLSSCIQPKLFMSGTRDQFAPRAELERVIEAAAAPKKLVLVEGADHFFEGRLREVRENIEAWLKEQLGR
jgi:hypothetical protein